MYIFDGKTVAQQAEAALQAQVNQLNNQGVQIKIAAILFVEDAGSKYYSQQKQQAADRVGISYQLQPFSITTSEQKVIKAIEQLNNDDTVTGIIIQKPTGRVWRQHNQPTETTFKVWWQQLYRAVAPAKDVDGLHPTTIAAIEAGNWQEQGRVLPATCRAVLKVMEHPKFKAAVDDQSKYLLIGRSDLLGKPLYHVLQQQGRVVEMIGKQGFNERIESGQQLKDANVIITATGREYLVTGVMVKDGVALIDVGEPRPDINRESIKKKAAFLTPVPGGVGPLTVVSLLENAVYLAKTKRN